MDRRDFLSLLGAGLVGGALAKAMPVTEPEPVFHNTSVAWMNNMDHCFHGDGIGGNARITGLSYRGLWLEEHEDVPEGMVYIMDKEKMKWDI